MRYRDLLAVGAACAVASSAHAFTDCAGAVKIVGVTPNAIYVTLDSGSSFVISMTPETGFSKTVSGLASTALVTHMPITVRYDQSGLDCSRAKDRKDLIALAFTAE